VARGSFISWVHDSSIVVTFGRPPSNILLGVPFSSCNVIIGFTNQKKIVNQVPDVYGVGFMDQGKNVVQVADFNIGGSCGSRFVMNSRDSFWNTMFEKELPKYKDWLDTIFLHHLLDTFNVNTTSGHVFNLLHNCILTLCM
jgi:hypothetical protein